MILRTQSGDGLGLMSILWMYSVVAANGVTSPGARLFFIFPQSSMLDPVRVFAACN